MKVCPACRQISEDSLRFCGKCGGEFGKPAGISSASSLSGIKTGCGCFGLMALAAAAIVIFGHSGDRKADANDKHLDAEVMCEKFVKDRLKSPGSAKFSGVSETTSVPLGAGYSVTGWVDSQNGFGALLRSRYTCQVEPTGGDNWRLKDLQIR